MAEQSEQERLRDAESRRKLEEHLAKMKKLGRVPTPEDDAREEREFRSDWEKWKQSYGGRVIDLSRAPQADPNADFKLLGVSPKATSAEMRRAFYKLAKANHPDHGGNPERFRALMEAYQRVSGGR